MLLTSFSQSIQKSKCGVNGHKYYRNAFAFALDVCFGSTNSENPQQVIGEIKDITKDIRHHFKAALTQSGDKNYTK